MLYKKEKRMGEYSKEYYKKRREFFLEYSKEYYETHREYYKEYYRSNKYIICKRSRDKWREKRNKILEFAGKKCIKCGFNDERALSIDHIDGRGFTRISWNKELNKILQSIEDKTFNLKFQILCFNCNQIKKVENNENPKWWHTINGQ